MHWQPSVTIFATGVLFANGDFPAFLVPVGFFLLILIGVIIAIVFNARWERQRTEALAGVAAGLGFEFYPKSDEGVIGQFGAFHLFQIGRAKTIKNLMQGAAQGL